MDNTNNNSSTSLFVGLILGILILGGLFLYFRSNNTVDTTDKGGANINLTLPTGNGSSGEANQ